MPKSLQSKFAKLPQEGITVVSFRIIRLQDDTLWLCKSTGEGMETTQEELAKALAKFWEKHF